MQKQEEILRNLSIKMITIEIYNTDNTSTRYLQNVSLGKFVLLYLCPFFFQCFQVFCFQVPEAAAQQLE